MKLESLIYFKINYNKYLKKLFLKTFQTLLHLKKLQLYTTAVIAAMVNLAVTK